MDNDLISIITPSYNCARYIGETIQSVLAQTYPYWELLITDDCSTDNTIETIRKFKESDPRISLFSTSCNTGTPAEPRNVSLRHARGKYIAFLDSDDIWLPEKLEEQIRFIKTYQYSFVYSDYEKIGILGDRSNRIVRVPRKTGYEDLLKSCTIPCLTVLCKAEIFQDLEFPATPKEDYIIWLKILKRNVVAYNTGSVLALYRENPGSRSSDKFRMFLSQWQIIRRREHINFFHACVCMMTYVFWGIRKYRI